MDVPEDARSSRPLHGRRSRQSPADADQQHAELMPQPLLMRSNGPLQPTLQAHGPGEYVSMQPSTTATVEQHCQAHAEDGGSWEAQRQPASTNGGAWSAQQAAGRWEVLAPDDAGTGTGDEREEEMRPDRGQDAANVVVGFVGSRSGSHVGTAAESAVPAAGPSRTHSQRLSHASSASSLQSHSQTERSSHASDKSRLELLRDQLLGEGGDAADGDGAPAALYAGASSLQQSFRSSGSAAPLLGPDALSSTRRSSAHTTGPQAFTLAMASLLDAGAAPAAVPVAGMPGLAAPPHRPGSEPLEATAQAKPQQLPALATRSSGAPAPAPAHRQGSSGTRSEAGSAQWGSGAAVLASSTLLDGDAQSGTLSPTYLRGADSQPYGATAGNDMSPRPDGVEPGVAGAAVGGALVHVPSQEMLDGGTASVVSSTAASPQLLGRGSSHVLLLATDEPPPPSPEARPTLSSEQLQATTTRVTREASRAVTSEGDYEEEFDSPSSASTASPGSEAEGRAAGPAPDAEDEEELQQAPPMPLHPVGCLEPGLLAATAAAHRGLPAEAFLDHWHAQPHDSQQQQQSAPALQPPAELPDIFSMHHPEPAAEAPPSPPAPLPVPGSRSRSASSLATTPFEAAPQQTAMEEAATQGIPMEPSPPAHFAPPPPVEPPASAAAESSRDLLPAAQAAPGFVRAPSSSNTSELLPAAAEQAQALRSNPSAPGTLQLQQPGKGGGSRAVGGGGGRVAGHNGLGNRAFTEQARQQQLELQVESPEGEGGAAAAAAAVRPSSPMRSPGRRNSSGSDVQGAGKEGRSKRASNGAAAVAEGAPKAAQRAATAAAAAAAATASAPAPVSRSQSARSPNASSTSSHRKSGSRATSRSTSLVTARSGPTNTSLPAALPQQPAPASQGAAALPNHAAAGGAEQGEGRGSTKKSQSLPSASAASERSARSPGVGTQSPPVSEPLGGGGDGWWPSPGQSPRATDEAAATAGPDAAAAERQGAGSSPGVSPNALVAIPPGMLQQLYEVLQGAASGQQPLSQSDLLLVSSLLWSLSNRGQAQGAASPRIAEAETSEQGTQTQLRAGAVSFVAAGQQTLPRQQQPTGVMEALGLLLHRPGLEHARGYAPGWQQEAGSATVQAREEQAQMQEGARGQQAGGGGEPAGQRRQPAAAAVKPPSPRSPVSDAGSATSGSSDVEAVAGRLKAKAVAYLARFNAGQGQSLLAGGWHAGVAAPGVGGAAAVAAALARSAPGALQVPDAELSAHGAAPPPFASSAPGTPGGGDMLAATVAAALQSPRGEHPLQQDAVGGWRSPGAVGATVSPSGGQWSRALASPDPGMAAAVAFALGGGSTAGAVEVALKDPEGAWLRGADEAEAGPPGEGRDEADWEEVEVEVGEWGTQSQRLRQRQRQQQRQPAATTDVARTAPVPQPALFEAAPAAKHRPAAASKHVRPPSLSDLLLEMQLLEAEPGPPEPQQQQLLQQRQVQEQRPLGASSPAQPSATASPPAEQHPPVMRGSAGPGFGSATSLPSIAEAVRSAPLSAGSPRAEPGPSPGGGGTERGRPGWPGDSVRVAARTSPATAAAELASSAAELRGHAVRPAGSPRVTQGSSQLDFSSGGEELQQQQQQQQQQQGAFGARASFFDAQGAVPLPRGVVATREWEMAKLAAAREREDAQVLLLRLRQAGYSPSEAAAAVLDLPLADLLALRASSGGGAERGRRTMSTDQISEELRMLGPMRVDAGWVSQVQPASATAGVGRFADGAARSHYQGRGVQQGAFASSSTSPLRRPSSAVAPSVASGYTTLTLHSTAGEQGSTAGPGASMRPFMPGRTRQAARLSQGQQHGAAVIEEQEGVGSPARGSRGGGGAAQAPEGYAAAAAAAAARGGLLERLGGSPTAARVQQQRDGGSSASPSHGGAHQLQISPHQKSYFSPAKGPSLAGDDRARERAGVVAAGTAMPDVRLEPDQVPGTEQGYAAHGSKSPQAARGASSRGGASGGGRSRGGGQSMGGGSGGWDDPSGAGQRMMDRLQAKLLSPERVAALLGGAGAPATYLQEWRTMTSHRQLLDNVREGLRERPLQLAPSSPGRQAQKAEQRGQQGSPLRRSQAQQGQQGQAVQQGGNGSGSPPPPRRQAGAAQGEAGGQAVQRPRAASAGRGRAGSQSARGASGREGGTPPRVRHAAAGVEGGAGRAGGGPGAQPAAAPARSILDVALAAKAAVAAAVGSAGGAGAGGPQAGGQGSPPLGSNGAEAAGGRSAFASPPRGGPRVRASAPSSPARARAGSPPGAGRAPGVVTAAMVPPLLALPRPSGWQERDTRVWLARLGLAVQADEEQAPLLQNPYRNGVLLGDVALALTGRPVPRLCLAPRDLKAARTNILVSMEHLGMLAELSRPALEQLATGRQASPDAGQRGYARQHQDRQLSSGLSLVWEVERVLQGQQDAIWGLLTHIRLNATVQHPFVRPATRGSPEPGTYAAAHSPRHRAGGERRPQRQGQAEAYHSTAAVWAAVSEATFAPHSHPGPRPGGGVGAGGKEQQGRQQQPAARRRASSAPRARRSGEQLVTAAPAMVASPSSVVAWSPGGGGMASSTRVAAASSPPSSPPRAPLSPRPLWRPPVLPYSEAEVAELEASVMRWLQEVGAIDADLAMQGFSHLLPQLADGTLICWLVSSVTRQHLLGVNKRPLNEAAARANWLKAIEAMRAQPNMARRFLNYEEALLHCERSAVLGLMEDLHRFSDGLPSAGTTLPAPGAAATALLAAAAAGPYLPYKQAMQEQLGRHLSALAAAEQPLCGAGKHQQPQTATVEAGGSGLDTAPIGVLTTSPSGQGGSSARTPRTHRSPTQHQHQQQQHQLVARFASPPVRARAAARGTGSGEAGVSGGHSSSTADLERYLQQQCAPYSPARGTQPGSILAALPHLRLVRQEAQRAGGSGGAEGSVQEEDVARMAQPPSALVNVVHYPA